VQVNGKVRGHVRVARDASEEEVRRAALEEPKVREHLAGRSIAKFVLVPGRLVSVVVR
jgi:leucyl-tRNA synthetase